MNKMINVAKLRFENNKTQLKFSVVVTIVVGLICHAYMFFQDSFSHDGINEFNADIYGNEWKIQLGRFVVPFYRMVTRGSISVPWLIGVISLVWIALAVFLVIKAFNIKSKEFILLTAGIFSTNIAVIATAATYIHDLDSNMFALLLSVSAFYLTTKYKYGCLLSIPLITLSMGLYQSYISVTVVLVIIFLIRCLLNEKKFKDVLFIGIKSVVSLILGAALYLVSYKSVLMVTGIQEGEGSYNTLDQMGFGSLSEFVNTIFYIFKTTIYNFLFPKNMVSQKLVFVLIVISVLAVALAALFRIVERKIGFLEVSLVFVLLVLLPVGMSVAGILMGDFGHDLMRFSDCLFFLLLLLIVYDSSTLLNDAKKVKKACLQCGKLIVVASVIVVLFGNILSANQIYLKKDLEQDSSLSFFTRVVDKMDMLEGYDRKTTPVVFVGRADCFDENKVGFSNGYQIMGATGNYVLGAAGPSWYERYFEYKLGYDILTVDNSKLDFYKESEFVKDMPIFPDDGCMQIVDGVLVVKLGEVAQEDASK